MSIIYFIITLVALISVFVISRHVLKRHRLWGKVLFPTGVPNTFLVLSALMFAVACIWMFVLELLHEMESPDFWVSAFRFDPILGDVFDYAEENNVDLGIPGASYSSTDYMMMHNVARCISTAKWCAVAGLVTYAVYLFALFKSSRTVLITCLALFSVCLFTGGRAAVSGMIHLSNWVFSNSYYIYDGNLDDSIMLPVLSICIAIVAVIGFIRGLKPINRYVSFAKSSGIVELASSSVTSAERLAPVNAENVTDGNRLFAGDNRSKAEKLTDLKNLLDAGILTDDEFTKMKSQILNS